MRTADIAMAAAVASLYAAVTYAFAPISFLPFQVRVSDALIMLPAALGAPAVLGVALGCLVANMFPYGYAPNIIDIVFGSAANLLAGYAVYKLAYGKVGKRRMLLSSLVAALIVTAVVGSYLPFIIPLEGEVTLLTLLTIGWLGVLPGEIVAVVLLGVPLAEVVKKASVA